jgi:hypothetical protein
MWFAHVFLLCCLLNLVFASYDSTQDMAQKNNGIAAQLDDMDDNFGCAAMETSIDLDPKRHIVEAR